LVLSKTQLFLELNRSRPIFEANLETQIECMKRLSLLVCLLGMVLLQSGCQTSSSAAGDPRTDGNLRALATPSAAEPGWTVVLPGDNL
jgi:hypothetical protein